MDKKIFKKYQYFIKKVRKLETLIKKLEYLIKALKKTEK